MKIESLEMRKMEPADISAVLAIEQVTSEEPWPIQTFESCLKPPFFAWVLVKENQILGYAILQIVGTDAHLLNFVVAPARQGQGWGYNTLSALLGRLIDRGVRRVTLEVRVSNTIAQGLYEKCGFVPVGRRVNYYVSTRSESGREDALVWELVVS